jgi:hypothetical protein
MVFARPRRDIQAGQAPEFNSSYTYLPKSEGGQNLEGTRPGLGCLAGCEDTGIRLLQVDLVQRNPMGIVDEDVFDVVPVG